ncbi:hypothetical protein PV328_002765 [Microctonus aethiopoides]|uniref:Uncharacterized protein n=1 Tax=Microctonus aethiopoides TaxID=144406 RepID=A0AA39F6Z5_9HYME|nr:hypothetical protein PV328_002765 [Microctonus aethiopoides]
MMAEQTKWENSCRLCSEEKIEMLSIFGEEGLRRQIPQKLRVCLPIMVYKTDPLPKQICQFCAARLDDAFEFRDYCLNIYKSMHLKFLASKNSNSVKIFLDAMFNSPDPCQVELCKIKQRAPPPLVPLPSSLSMNKSTSSLVEIPKVERISINTEPLPELPIEVQIKEEPSEITTKRDLISHGDDSNQSFTDENLQNDNESSARELVDYTNENISVKSESTCNEKKTSILEQVLTGNLTINDCQESVPKTELSSEWWCSLCNNYCQTKESLVEHMQFYCPCKYACGKCSLVFKTVEELAKHEAKDHLKITLNFNESIKECHQCDREFVSWEMLRLHRLQDHYVGSIEFAANTWCPLCNRFFQNEELYRDHQQLHESDSPIDAASYKMNHDERNVQEQLNGIEQEHFIESIKNLTCPTCGKICTQQSALSNHMRTHEPKKHKCDICGRSFGLFIRLAAHKLSEHNLQPTAAPIMTSVEQEEALNDEREAREAHKEKLNKNDRCRKFSETLDDDESIVNEQRPAKRSALINNNSPKNVARCGICQEWFNDHTTMLNHLKVHSENVFPKNFSCTTCGKSFKENWQLQRHERSHKRPIATIYECSVCNKPFPDKARLDTHEKIHIVDKTYHCPKCNKIFFKELSLITHQCTGVSLSTKRNSAKAKTNQKKATSPVVVDKKFKCSKCPEMFDTTQLRNLHSRIHTEPKLPSPSDMDLDDTKDSMPKLRPVRSPASSLTLLEPKVEILVDQNPLVPQKRTLIRTTGGYRCGVCQSPFVLRELAVAHLRAAHPVMPYQCPYCKKRFTTQYTFTHHIKTDHPDESEK